MASLPQLSEQTEEAGEARMPAPMSREDQRKEHEKQQAAVGPLLLELNGLAAEAIAYRKPIEERWLEDLRQYHGVYDPDVAGALRNFDGSKADDDDSRSRLFINITRPKTNAWNARLSDMLFPNDDKNWGINPTPVPELTDSSKAAVQEAEQAEAEAKAKTDEHNAQVDAGQNPSPDLAQQADAAAQRGAAARAKQAQTQKVLDEARECATKMETEIKDQLVEARYGAKCRDVIDDQTKVGIGVLKGPIVSSKPRRQWAASTVTDYSTGEQTQIYELNSDSSTPRAGWRRVNYWHYFPDPNAESVEEASYNFERHLPNKKMLRKMARDLDFNKFAVSQLLEMGPAMGHGGPSTDLGYFEQLRAIDGTGQETSTIDTMRERYVIWEYHGQLENEQVAEMMRATGRLEEADEFMKQADPLDARMVRVFFCGTTLLKIEEEYLLDSGECLYSVASFEKAEASILGAIGVPRLMRSEQRMLNSAVRMMMDNAALAVGPQVVIDKEAIEPENGKWGLTPRKVWRRIKNYTNQEKGNRPFETYTIDMNQSMLAAIVEMAMRFVDEAVSMPLIAQGEQGEHITQTKGGMTMLFNSASVVFRRVVKNWDDDVTSGAISRAYDFNMQFSPKDEIKGDMKVEARGTSVLLVREMQAEQLLNIVDRFATHPILGVAIKAYECMRLILQAMSINPNDVLEDFDTYMEKLKSMGENDNQSSPEEIRAQASIEVANIDAKSRTEQAQSNERIAELRANTAYADLGAKHNLSLAQIQAMFEGKKLDAAVKERTAKMANDSKERTLAAEIAVENQNKREAEAKGLEPTGSGGAISMGAKNQ